MECVKNKYSYYLHKFNTVYLAVYGENLRYKMSFWLSQMLLCCLLVKILVSPPQTKEGCHPPGLLLNTSLLEAALCLLYVNLTDSVSY